MKNNKIVKKRIKRQISHHIPLKNSLNPLLHEIQYNAIQKIRYMKDYDKILVRINLKILKQMGNIQDEIKF